LRKLTRITGYEIVHASGSGGYIFNFTTADHVHGWYDDKEKEWGINMPQEHHFTSCRTLFPQTIDSPPPPGGD